MDLANAPKNRSVSTPKTRARSPARGDRSGAILVWVALMLIVLLGFVGLVIDLGMLLTAHRHTQNVADGAALAAVMELFRGKSEDEALAAANRSIEVNNRPDKLEQSPPRAAATVAR